MAAVVESGHHGLLDRVSRGFTLIEILIALSVFAFLIMLAGPMYSEFMANSQIRNRAESALAGVRLAQNEAIKRNAQAKLATTANGWQVSWFNDETSAFEVLQSYDFSEGALKTTAVADQQQVTFNGIGRVISPNPGDGNPPMTRIRVTNPSVASSRELDVVISSLATGTKLCDPDPGVAASDPRACP
jgi:type IV fimbrial biogenesis protein FimT